MKEKYIPSSAEYKKAEEMAAETEGKNPELVSERSVEEIATMLGIAPKALNERIKDKDSFELQKAFVEHWVEQVKSKDEYFDRQNTKLADEFDSAIKEAKKEGRLEDFLRMKDMSIGTNFDDYMILEQSLKIGIERYLKNAELIKRLVKVRNDNGLQSTHVFSTLNDDIRYFGRKLLEKLRRSNLPQKEESIAKIEEMMKV